MKINTRIYLNQSDSNQNPGRSHRELLGYATYFKASANITLDGCFAIKGIRILEGKDNNLFISMPSRKIGNEYKEDCFPVTKPWSQMLYICCSGMHLEFRDQLNNEILGEYQQKLENIQKQTEQVINQSDSQSNCLQNQSDYEATEPELNQHNDITMSM